MSSDFFIDKRPATNVLTLSQRLIGFLRGTLLGLLTFTVWLLALVANDLMFSPGTAILLPLYIGAKLSLLLALVFGLVGFFWGGDTLARFFDFLWGSDDRLQRRSNTVAVNLPLWLIYLILFTVVVGAVGYLVLVLNEQV